MRLRLLLFTLLSLGLSMALAGFALTLDLFSLRGSLVALGIGRGARLTGRVHDVLQHSGAQTLELALGLAGLVLVGWVVWWACRSESFRRWATRIWMFGRESS